MVLEYFLSMTLCYHKLHYRYRNRRVSLALLYDGIRQCLLHTPKQILCFVRPHIVQSYMPEAKKLSDTLGHGASILHPYR